MATKEELAQAEMKAKGKPLKKMFDQVPEKYDFLNRIMTLGLDEPWRKKAVNYIKAEQPLKVMDLGTGTGDMALRIAREIPAASITAYDFSGPMLSMARNKAQKQGINNIEFIEGDAAAMPFDENSFDVIGISFAFRNITFRNKNTSIYLREILRVLKPGGKLIAVESSQPNNRLIRSGFHFYLKHIVSGLGERFGKARGAYHYLAYSARNFYSTTELTELLQSHGFGKVKHHRMFLGAAAITIAEKPANNE